VPIATLGSLGGAAVVYALVHAVAVLAVPNLPSVEGPLQCAGERLGGASFGTLIGLGAGISAGGIAFGTVVMTPRYLAALGRQDGLGTWIAQQGVARVPRRALAVTASLAGLLVFLALGTGLADGLRALFVLSSIMVLLQYAVSAAALVALSARRRAGLRPRDLWPAPLAFATIFAIGAAATTDELLVGAAAIGLGALVPLARRLGVTPGAAPRG
jgi:APA family basic amino acid/polyamine antiporter